MDGRMSHEQRQERYSLVEGEAYDSEEGVEVEEVDEEYEERVRASMEQARKTYSLDLTREHATHLYDLPTLANVHPESRINAGNPANSQGLSQDQARKQLLQDGPNCLTPAERDSLWWIFLKQYTNPFLILLMIAAGLAILGYGLLDIQNGEYENLILFIALTIVVLLTGYLSFRQERAAQAAMDSFSNMMPSEATVIRDGERHFIAADELVVGDIVVLNPGEKIPADMRILHCTELKVECAALTGESEPVPLSADAEEDPSVLKTESRCLGFSSSLILEGNGIGLVVATGDNTVVGSVAKLTTTTNNTSSNLEKEVTRFVYFIAALALTMALIFFVIGVARRKGEDWLFMFITGFLLVIVANVPQGLPSTVTSLLTLTAEKMAKKNVLVKKLDCIETLGATSVICSDKTGTLTKNEMTVVDTWCGGVLGFRTFEELANNYDSHDDDSIAAGRLMMAVGAVCNNAVVEKKQEKEKEDPDEDLYNKEEELKNERATNKKGSSQRSSGRLEDEEVGVFSGQREGTYVGNPTEMAIVKFLDRIKFHENLRSTYPFLHEMPFSSKTKFHAMLVDISADPRPFIPLLGDGNNKPSGRDMPDRAAFMKGAPERVLARCTTYLDKGKLRPMDADFEAEFKQMYEKFAGKGQRVIGTACRIVSPGDAGEEDIPLNDLTFLGLYGIMDPPRDDVPDAVKQCQEAGVRVFMVTGDHYLTARAISTQIGILNEKMDVVVLGGEEGGDAKIKVPEVSPDAYVVCGWVIDQFNDEMWDEVLSKQSVVFARTTPQDKLSIVSACQDRGEVVAVTGDGVNDGPALKKADIGVSMGLCGSEVAREAANLILMDDNFASIVTGIEMGRVIWDNLKKTIAYTLSHLFPEILPVLLLLSFGLPQGLSSLQILTIDLLTEMPPAISLSYEGAENDVMKRLPRNVHTDHLVTAPLVAYSYLEIGVIEAIACVTSYIIAFHTFDISMTDIAFTDDKFFEEDSEDLCVGNGKCYDADEQIDILRQVTATWYMTLILSQSFHIWMCKTRRVSFFRHPILENKTMIVGVIIELLLMIIFVFIPGLNTEVMSTDIPFWWSWMPGVICGLSICVFNELRKKAIRRRPHWLLSRALAW